MISGVATSGGGSTILTLNVAGMAARTYLLDAFSSAPGDAPAASRIDAHVLLATASVTIPASPPATMAVNLPVTVAGGLAGDGHLDDARVGRSVGSDARRHLGVRHARLRAPAVPGDDDRTRPGRARWPPRSPRTNLDTSNPSADTIAFQLPTSDPGYEPDHRDLDHHALAIRHPAAITHPVIIDATTQKGYAGTPVVEINGANPSGLVLDPGAANSTIRGLDLVHFAGRGPSTSSRITSRSRPTTSAYCPMG